MMTLLRRCDGCGNDIQQPEKAWRIVRPKEIIDLDFHDEKCIALWADRDSGVGRV